MSLTSLVKTSVGVIACSGYDRRPGRIRAMRDRHRPIRQSPCPPASLECAIMRVAIKIKLLPALILSLPAAAARCCAERPARIAP